MSTQMKPACFGTQFVTSDPLRVQVSASLLTVALVISIADELMVNVPVVKTQCKLKIFGGRILLNSFRN